MEESTLFNKIRDVMMYTPGHFMIKPAWKYAYYNAARKDPNGQVIVGDSIPGAYLMLGFFALIAVLTLLDGAYPITILAVGLLIVMLLIMKFVPRQTVIVSKEGLIVTDTLYKWDDYDGAYIAVVAAGRSRVAQLVFVKDNNPSAYIILGSYRDLSKIATPIRDFQPERYKDLYK